MPTLPLLHADEAVVAVDKPSGMASVPAGEAPSVWRALEDQLGCRLWVVHRLDRDASGVLLFARSADAHRWLSLAFERRNVQKTYLAITLGHPVPAAGSIEVPLHAARRGGMRPARPGESGALEAVTAYRTRAAWQVETASAALLDVRPRTGRRHQIRVHLRSAGTPLLFDRRYGFDLPDRLGGAPAARLALHASRLAVPRPDGSGTLEIEAPLAPDLASLVRWLDGIGRAVRP